MRAISDVKAFRALLEGGYICEKFFPARSRPIYNVFTRDEASPSESRLIGHITERQFGSFLSGKILDLDPKSNRTDKYGNVLNFYVLALPSPAPVKEVV